MRHRYVPVAGSEPVEQEVAGLRVYACDVHAAEPIEAAGAPPHQDIGRMRGREDHSS